ncbi:MAG TPA: type IV toxin-antitoxin system AbiEi family antitoxin domain-containing protein [Thermoleophilaceae bacterium]|jgi:very-short-patch-repair endonuclease
MDVQIRMLAERQADVVAAWQLLAAGYSRRTVERRVLAGGWRTVHRGVYALTQAPLTRRQRWMAATLTSSGTVLSHASAGACWGFRPYEGRTEVVTRPGSGGPRMLGSVLVLRSTTLDGDVASRDGIAITTPERTLVDLAPHLHPRAAGKALREAIRLRLTTAPRLLAALVRHRRRRGTALLADLATRYASLPYDRSRSDAESRALELLHDAGVRPPRVNVKVAGEEADLTWPDRRLIVEIDGPQFHRFAEEDARKQLVWERAGYTVRRLPSDAVFLRPGELIAAACREPKGGAAGRRAPRPG